MDIRNFFGGKGTNTKSQSSKVVVATGLAEPVIAEISKSSVASSRRLGADASSSSNGRKKSLVLEVDESDDSRTTDEDILVISKKTSLRKRRTPVSREERNHKESPPLKRITKLRTNKDEKKESDSDDEIEFVSVTQPKSTQKERRPKRELGDEITTPKSPNRSSPRKKPKADRDDALNQSSPKQRSSKAKKPTREPPLKPTRTASSIDTDKVTPECLSGYTFVFTGVLPNLSREESQELVKVLGGRVTGDVSGKTDYLVVGPVLEDGRDFSEGSKYKKAIEKNVHLVLGEDSLYGLILQYDAKIRGESNESNFSQFPASVPKDLPITSKSVKSRLYNDDTDANAVAVANTKTDSKFVNPYARNKKAPAAAVKKEEVAVKLSPTHKFSNDLWVDKYKPMTTKEILGNQEAVRKLTAWLARWEERFNNSSAVGKAFSNPQGPWKAALLSGPPGIGKTTTASLVAKEDGRDVIEFNASDVRSKNALKDGLGDITGSQTISFSKKKHSKPMKRCIVMDEVDGMGGGDRGGVAELIQLIKFSHVPIICICNDRLSQKLKSLLPYCMDLRYRRPVKTVIAARALEIAAQEGFSVERNAAEAIAESCGNDIRQVVNCLQMWASNRSNSKMTYKDLRERENSINKDEILRVSLFDAAKQIIEGRRNLSNADTSAERESFFKRNDAFFVDYSFVGLIVQQNYLKVVNNRFSQAKAVNDRSKITEVLDDMYSAAESMSDYTFAENSLRSEQNWSLLPFVGMNTIKCGFHAGGINGGFLPGYTEFSAWLGKNSSKGKKLRLLLELRHHTNYKVSGATEEMRLSYIPVFRNRLLSLLSTDGSVDEAIQLMDEYGLDRDDVFEKLDEFSMDSKAPSFANIESRRKAAFTRAYNEGVHKSQALVAEQCRTTKPKRQASASTVPVLGDPDAIDDDNVLDDDEVEVNAGDDEDDDDDDVEKIKAMFQKKRRSKASAKPNKSAVKPKAKSTARKGK